MKLNGLKEERYIDEITPKDTKMYLEVLFWSHESFAGLYFLDLENETFSQHHIYNKFRTIFDFKRIFENLKNGSIDYFEMLIMYAW